MRERTAGAGTAVLGAAPLSLRPLSSSPKRSQFPLQLCALMACPALCSLLVALYSPGSPGPAQALGGPHPRSALHRCMPLRCRSSQVLTLGRIVTSAAPCCLDSSLHVQRNARPQRLFRPRPGIASTRHTATARTATLPCCAAGPRLCNGVQGRRKRPAPRLASFAPLPENRFCCCTGFGPGEPGHSLCDRGILRLIAGPAPRVSSTHENFSQQQVQRGERRRTTSQCSAVSQRRSSAQRIAATVAVIDIADYPPPAAARGP